MRNLIQGIPSQSRLKRQELRYLPEQLSVIHTGDCFEDQGNVSSAIQYVSKAFALSVSDYHKRRIEALQEKSK